MSAEAQRAWLARRLRPLYPGLRSDEFERMVARIAEIELYGSFADTTGNVAGAAPRRTHGSATSAQGLAS